MITLKGSNLTLKNFIQVVRQKEAVTIDEQAVDRIETSRDVVNDIVKDKRVVYGINTGFGKLSDVSINSEKLDQLQLNLLRSHACGTGNIFDEEIVRGMLLLRINALLKGYSGIRLETIEKMIELLNHDIIPVVYEQGSLGASGDLVPLAHMALPLIGEGEVFLNHKRMKTLDAFKQSNIKPLDGIHAKEGLALINGTQAMTSVGALALYDSYYLYLYSIISGGLTLEATNGIIDAFDSRIHTARGQKGQMRTAEMMRKLLMDSKNITKQGDLRVQDAYSIRCIPQVHGASLDTFDYILDKVEIEMNAVTDNPIVFTEDNSAISAGNFHGQPVALPFDFLSIAISELANISERRLERLVNDQLNDRFPAFLVKEKGLNSGFMIVQYAAASLVSENKILAHPASVDSIPSSANQEDHVSMGTIAARKARQVLKHSINVVAMEIFTACQALDFEGKEKLSPQLKAVYNKVREVVPFIEEDEIMKPHMDAITNLLTTHVLPTEELEALLWKKL